LPLDPTLISMNVRHNPQASHAWGLWRKWGVSPFPNDLQGQAGLVRKIRIPHIHHAFRDNVFAMRVFGKAGGYQHASV